MNRLLSLKSSAVLLGLVALIFVGLANANDKDGSVTIEAQLIWGTNDETSPNPKHKAVGPVMAEKLNKSPFKWKRYFEEERKCISVSKDTPQKVELSKSATLVIQNLGDDLIKVKLVGDGKDVAKNTGSIAMGETMLIGGDAKNDTAWFIMLRQVEKKK